MKGAIPLCYSSQTGEGKQEKSGGADLQYAVSRSMQVAGDGNKVEIMNKSEEEKLERKREKMTVE